MQCPSCGHQNRPNVRFCNRCGASLAQGNQPVNMPSPQNPVGVQMTDLGGLGYQSPTTANRPSPASMSHQPMPVQPAPPIQRGRQGGIPGVARNIQQRTEPYGARQQTVLTFLLQQYDNSGNRIRVVPVEMRGVTIKGFILDGNQVEVFGKEEEGLLRTKQVYNISTASMVKRKLW